MKYRYWFSILLLLLGAGAAVATTLRVHFIAVGHGDAILIESEGRVALVDAGSATNGPAVAAYLKSTGCYHINHLCATHTHQDHIGAMPLLLDSLQVDTIHVTGMVDGGDEAKTLTSYLQSSLWIVDTTEIGDTLVQWDDVQIVVLSPPAIETAGMSVDGNANSMVLMVTHGQVKILLTADIDRKREQWLIENYGGDLEAEVLKAPHHGSRAGNSLEFLQVVNPQVTVISTGLSGWNYPSAETVQRIRENCPTVFRTDQDGTVIIESDGRDIRMISPGKTKP